MSILHACMYMYCSPAWCLKRSAEGVRVRSPGTGVMDYCELPCGCLASNLGPLQE